MTIMIEKSWKSVLEKEFKEGYVDRLKDFLGEEKKKGKVIYPPFEEVFYALKCTPFEDVKVVIIGQDPYHGPGQAHGLCFSVQKGVPLPPSLRNIYKELASDVGVPTPKHGCLSSWATQGVLLLNATLTVEQGLPLSHHGKGWERFTDAIVRALSEREDPIVFILWGRSAAEKCERILDHHKGGHVVLKSAHPSPLSATGFFGTRPFSQANQWLERWGKKPIDWRIPD